jgi:polyferredoxin
MAERRRWQALRWLRRTVQVGALAFFVYLLFAAVQSPQAAPEGTFFFRFDPLAAFATMLASRSWLPQFELALATVVLAVVAGRVWCGWICPLGTLLGWVRFKGARQQAKGLPPRLRVVKYALLIAIVVMAGLGVMTLMIFDPIAFLTRTATTVIIPGLDYVVTGVESAMMHVAFLQGTVGFLESHLRGPVLPVTQPHYAQAVFLGLLFLGVLLLNALADDFWCRYLCPLGALLGLVSKVALFRPLVSDACDSCGRCAAACRLGAIESARRRSAAATANESVDTPPADRRTDPTTAVVASECTVCLDCLVACPEPKGMGFGLNLRPGPWQPYDPGRRDLIFAAAAGVGGVALLGTGVWAAGRDQYLIRPPGVTSEARFLDHCLRCTECMKVCPTSGLQPTLTEAGLTGLWTPVLKPRLGYCLYVCNACGQTCPSGAIPKLSLPVKQRQVIGTAVIDRNRCLPWARNVPCAVCQEMCPLPRKAITLGQAKLVKNAQGGANWMERPTVVAGRCIGCGICEYQCPLEGPAAIRVERPSVAVSAAPEPG